MALLKKCYHFACDVTIGQMMAFAASRLCHDRAYLMTKVGSAYKVEPLTGTAFMPVGGGVGSGPRWLHRTVLECDRPALSS